MKMFIYAKVENQQVVGDVLGPGQLLDLLPEGSTNPEFMTEEELVAAGAIRVETPEYPEDDYRYTPSIPVFENGVWTTTWIQHEAPDRVKNKPVIARSHRVSRDTLLKESDWTQMPDSPLTDEQKALWAAYRQELRDVTDQAGFPWKFNWPSKPQ
jgi:hypothetical protein